MSTLQGANLSRFKGTFQDDSPFPQMGYVSSLEGRYLPCFTRVQHIFDCSASRRPENATGLLRAAVWFWLFMIVMVLFLMNMLLAIIMDAYQMEKYKASDATTLWQQILDMIQRRRQYTRGERVRLTDVWNTFRCGPKDKTPGGCRFFSVWCSFLMFSNITKSGLLFSATPRGGSMLAKRKPCLRARLECNDLKLRKTLWIWEFLPTSPLLTFSHGFSGCLFHYQHFW